MSIPNRSHKNCCLTKCITNIEQNQRWNVCRWIVLTNRQARSRAQTISQFYTYISSNFVVVVFVPWMYFTLYLLGCYFFFFFAFFVFCSCFVFDIKWFACLYEYVCDFCRKRSYQQTTKTNFVYFFLLFLSSSLFACLSCFSFWDGSILPNA